VGPRSPGPGPAVKPFIVRICFGDGLSLPSAGGYPESIYIEAGEHLLATNPRNSNHDTNLIIGYRLGSFEARITEDIIFGISEWRINWISMTNDTICATSGSSKSTMARYLAV